jgi:L-aminopeptidase/D-esterase-like protein
VRNLITDVAGLRVGHAQDAAVASGVTVAVFDGRAAVSASVQGGAPGTRAVGLLGPEMTVPKIDAVVLSGGSEFGLDAAGGVINALSQRGTGFEIAGLRVPIASQAILFDLVNGGRKPWLSDPEHERPPYWELGLAAALAAEETFALGTVGAGAGATTANLKGGLGSSSTRTPSGFVVGALVAVNALGSTVIGDGPHFWAGVYEREGEFGGLGWPESIPADALVPRMKAGVQPSTTIGLVATDAALTKAACKRLAIMAHDGLARAIRPVHAPVDGDTLFAAATGRNETALDPIVLTELGLAAADCVARAIARGVYEAQALPFAGALPAWKDLFSARRTGA